jgi:hypothetical protein
MITYSKLIIKFLQYKKSAKNLTLRKIIRKFGKEIFNEIKGFAMRVIPLNILNTMVFPGCQGNQLNLNPLVNLFLPLHWRNSSHSDTGIEHKYALQVYSFRVSAIKQINSGSACHDNHLNQARWL